MRTLVLMRGAPGCVDCDTEFFNGKEWKRIADWTEEDKVLQYNQDGTAELVQPICYIKQPCNELYHLYNYNGSIQQIISDNHNVVYITSKNHINTKPFKDIKDKIISKSGYSAKIINSFVFKNKNFIINDDLIKLQIAISADGSRARNKWRIRLYKKRKIERIIKILNNLNIPIDKRIYADGSTNFYIPIEYGEKIFPKEYYNLNEHQKQIFLKEIFLWDGYLKGQTYYTTIKENADLVQFILSQFGFRCSINIDNRIYGTHKSICYQVHLTKQKYTTLRQHKNSNFHTMIEKYTTIDGYEYCFTVSSHMLVLRRENCIFITGNCGKSTFIREHGLEPYTLSADIIRLQYSSPVLNLNGEWSIPQTDDKIVWKTLFQMLEKRMQNGCFTVIDATNSKTAEILRYQTLCSKYRYRIFCVDFTDIPIEVCKARNAGREQYKIVPEYVLEEFYNRFKTQKIPKDIQVIKPEEFDDVIKYTPMDLSEYDNVYIIGDIHGCKQPLDDFNDDIFNHNGVNNYFIFCGDYIDRGTQNAEILEFLYKIKDNKNVFLLEGNHERHIYKWATDEIPSSKEFIDYTLPQIEKSQFTKKKAREFYRRLAQCCYFKYGDKTFLVSHGGISRIPEELLFVPTSQLIKGVGKYSEYKKVTEIFESNNNGKQYLVNGHRNIEEFNIKVSDHCYNLEGKVELGGNLRVMRIGKDLSFECLEYPNKLPIAEHLEENKRHLQNNDSSAISNEEQQQIANVIADFRKNKYVVEKQFGNISSFNFSREAFYGQIWNDITVKARGLYFDTKQNRVFCRGYEKFFKIDETEETKMSSLKNTLQFPLSVYQKENGYLGLVSYDYNTDDLFLTTKSNPNGDYAINFKKLFRNKVDPENQNTIKEYLKQNNYTIVMEVIDPQFDPHIIKYNDCDLVVLDLIKNQLQFSKVDYEITVNFAKTFGLSYKKNIRKLFNWEEFQDFANNAPATDILYSNNNSHIEGWVIEDSKGFMIKIKSDYYNIWKMLRGIANTIIRTGKYQYLGSSQQLIQNYFCDWLLKNWERYHYDDYIKKDIISLREDFFKDNPQIKNSY